jgi:carboxylate-amine ligase
LSHNYLPRYLCASCAPTIDPRLTLGVEEEFHLVDSSTRRLTARAAEVLRDLASSTATYTAELQQSVVETNTQVTPSLAELRQDLVSLRTELVRAAEPLGVGVAAAGTMPLTAPLKITEMPRFRRMLADYQLLAREQLICGMQVHVGMPDKDLAARLLGRLGPWLPPLLALSASSPFSQSVTFSGTRPLPGVSASTSLISGSTSHWRIAPARMAPSSVRDWSRRCGRVR